MIFHSKESKNPKTLSEEPSHVLAAPLGSEFNFAALTVEADESAHDYFPENRGEAGQLVLCLIWEALFFESNT